MKEAPRTHETMTLSEAAAFIRVRGIGKSKAIFAPPSGLHATVRGHPNPRYLPRTHRGVPLRKQYLLTEEK